MYSCFSCDTGRNHAVISDIIRDSEDVQGEKTKTKKRKTQVQESPSEQTKTKTKKRKAPAQGKQKTKKVTKKQLALEEMLRARELSSYNNVWGNQNAKGMQFFCMFRRLDAEISMR